MSERGRMGLDNPQFHGRLRTSRRDAQSFTRVAVRPSRSSPRNFSDILVFRPVQKPALQAELKPKPVVDNRPKVMDIHLISPQPFAKPARSKLQPTGVLNRQAVSKPAPLMPAIKSGPRKHSPMQIALITMSVTIFMIGVFVSLITLQTNHSAKAQVAALAQKADQNSATDSNAVVVPSETKPSTSTVASTSYHVAPDMPKTLKIAKLNVDARIKPLGVTNNNELQAPTNIYDTGWYNASAKPGQPGSNGAMVIDGHVHGPTLPGVFVDIKKLVPGDTLQVIRGDNTSFTYVVKKVQNYDANTFDMGMLLTSIQPGEPGLNLITCGGPYDRNSGEYTQRTVVFTVQQ